MKDSVSHITLPFVYKLGEWVGIYNLPKSDSKIFNIFRTAGSFLWNFGTVKKTFLEAICHTKSKILSFCACKNCNFLVQLIIYWPSFTWKNSVPSSVLTSLRGMNLQLKLGINNSTWQMKLTDNVIYLITWAYLEKVFGP